MALKVLISGARTVSLASPARPWTPASCLRHPFSSSTGRYPSSYSIGRNPNPNPTPSVSRRFYSTSETADQPITEAEKLPLSDAAQLVQRFYFVPPGVRPEEVTTNMVLPGSNIVIGPYARHHHIQEVEFVKSSSHAKECPKDDRPEFAILGRSNVGKSSLINALVGQKKLAPTSKTPGKTQFINHYLVNRKWLLVDLPGYGFANAPDSVTMEWNSFTKGYFIKRETLVAVLLLVDANVPPKKIDLDCAIWLERNEIPMTFVFTKCDKLRGGKGKGKGPDVYLKEFRRIMGERYSLHPPWIMTSSVDGFGINDLLRHIAQLRNFWSEK